MFHPFVELSKNGRIPWEVFAFIKILQNRLPSELRRARSAEPMGFSWRGYVHALVSLRSFHKCVDFTTTQISADGRCQAISRFIFLGIVQLSILFRLGDIKESTFFDPQNQPFFNFCIITIRVQDIGSLSAVHPLSPSWRTKHRQIYCGAKVGRVYRRLCA